MAAIYSSLSLLFVTQLEGSPVYCVSKKGAVIFFNHDITGWSSSRTVIMSTVVNRVFIFYNLFSLKYLEAITLRKN
jgi:hypothetical protein